MEPNADLPAGPGKPLPALPAPSPELPPVPKQPPVGRFVIAGLLVIALFFGGFGAWAGLAPLASAAIASGTVLEEAARAMTSANQSLAHVVDPAGRPLGAVSLSAIITAMVTATSHETKAA